MTKRKPIGILAIVVLATNCIVFFVTRSILDRQHQQELWLQLQRVGANQLRVDIAIALKIRHGQALEAGNPRRVSALESLESLIDGNLIPFRSDIQEGRSLSSSELDALKRASLYREKYPRRSAQDRQDETKDDLQAPKSLPDSMIEEVLRYGKEHGTLEQPWFIEQL